MKENEYREYLINEIITNKKRWCKRNNENAETLEAKSTKVLETIFDRAK